MVIRTGFEALHFHLMAGKSYLGVEESSGLMENPWLAMTIPFACGMSKLVVKFDPMKTTKSQFFLLHFLQMEKKYYLEAMMIM